MTGLPPYLPMYRHARIGLTLRKSMQHNGRDPFRLQTQTVVAPKVRDTWTRLQPHLLLAVEAEQQRRAEAEVEVEVVRSTATVQLLPLRTANRRILHGRLVRTLGRISGLLQSSPNQDK